MFVWLQCEEKTFSILFYFFAIHTVLIKTNTNTDSERMSDSRNDENCGRELKKSQSFAVFGYHLFAFSFFICKENSSFLFYKSELKGFVRDNLWYFKIPPILVLCSPWFWLIPANSASPPKSAWRRVVQERKKKKKEILFELIDLRRKVWKIPRFKLTKRDN